MGQVVSFPYGAPYEDAIIRQEPAVEIFSDAEVIDLLGMTISDFEQRKKHLNQEILSMFEELVSFGDKNATYETMCGLIRLERYYNRDWDGAA